jgi:hypothetical protein
MPYGRLVVCLFLGLMAVIAVIDCKNETKILRRNLVIGNSNELK